MCPMDKKKNVLQKCELTNILAYPLCITTLITMLHIQKAKETREMELEEGHFSFSSCSSPP